MKKALFVFAAILALAANASAQIVSVTGVVLAEPRYLSYESLPFSQIILSTADSIPIAEYTTGFDARFKLEVIPGNYTLTVSHPGYHTSSQPVFIHENTDIGGLILKEHPIRITIIEDLPIEKMAMGESTSFGIEKLTVQY